MRPSTLQCLVLTAAVLVLVVLIYTAFHHAYYCDPTALDGLSC